MNTENGDDVLQVFVALQHFLDTASNIVVFFTDHLWIEQTAGGGQRINGGIDTLLKDGSLQHNGRVEVGKGCGWSRVSIVVSRAINSLPRGYSTALARGDALLHFAHL